MGNTRNIQTKDEVYFRHVKTYHMLIESKHQNVDLWEVWVDLQAANQENAATLYLIGDVYTDSRLTKPYFIKKEHPDPEVLLLEIYPGVASDDGYVTEIMYSEELKHVDQYSAILINAGDEFVARLHDIEKIA